MDIKKRLFRKKDAPTCDPYIVQIAQQGGDGGHYEEKINAPIVQNKTDTKQHTEIVDPATLRRVGGL